MKRALRKTAEALAIALISLGALEIGLRAVFAFKAGPLVLLYGTQYYRSDVSVAKEIKRTFRGKDWNRFGENWHEIVRFRDFTEKFSDATTGAPAYYKYAPGARLRIQLKGSADPKNDHKPYATRMNNHGFRGADFSIEKKAGVFRILTLGASSTFGYSNKDNETYPRYLEKRLNEALRKSRCAGVEEFEVYNFGIPHLRSFEIHSLLLSEGLQFSPDLITFYEGANDTREVGHSWAAESLKSSGEVLLTAKFVAYLFDHRMATFSESEAEALIPRMQRTFSENVAKVASAAESRRIQFLPVLQPMTNELKNRVAEPAGLLSYQQEADLVRQKLREGGRVLLPELQMLLHAEINRNFRQWLLKSQSPYVDFIRIMEEKGARGEFTSWIHLSARGNQLLAEAIKEQVLQLACRAGS